MGESLKVDIILSNGDIISFESDKDSVVLPTLDAITSGAKTILITQELTDKFGKPIEGKILRNHLFLNNIVSFELDMWKITDEDSNLPNKLKLNTDVEIQLVNGKVLPVKMNEEELHTNNDFLFNYRELDGKGKVSVINKKFISNILEVVDV